MAVLLLAALLSLPIAACSSGRPLAEDERRERPLDEQRVELMARPTNAEIRVVYERMIGDIERRLGEQLGLRPWERDPRSVSRAGCSDFASELGGESGGGGSWYYDRNVPDGQWPDLTRTVEQVAVDDGFQPLEHVSDDPGNQYLTTTDRFGATFSIGNGPAAASLGISLGCHPLR